MKLFINKKSNFKCTILISVFSLLIFSLLLNNFSFATTTQLQTSASNSALSNNDRLTSTSNYTQSVTTNENISSNNGNISATNANANTSNLNSSLDVTNNEVVSRTNSTVVKSVNSLDTTSSTNLDFNMILNIILIAFGFVLILLAFAILVRLKK